MAATDARLARLDFVGTIRQLSDEVTALVLETNFVRFSHLPSGYVDGLVSVRLLRDSIAAVTNPIDSDRLGGCTYHPSRYSKRTSMNVPLLSSLTFHPSRG